MNFPLTLGLTALFFTSCTVSRIHVGYHFASEELNAQKSVSAKVDSEIFEIEKAAVRAVHSYDIGPLIPYFSQKLAQTIPPQTLKSFNAYLRKHYKFAESIEQIKLGTLIPRTLPSWKDNFKIFDFVSSNFILDGSPGASLKMYTTKINGAVKICGLYIVPLDEDPSPDKSLRGSLAPETLDKNGAFKKIRPEKSAPAQ